MAFPTELGRTSHTARFLCLVDLTVNNDYGVDVVVRRTDGESCGLKLDPIEQMLIDVGAGDLFGVCGTGVISKENIGL